jgi:hypothetical protein
MTKSKLSQLAFSDGLEIRFSGKNKIAYLCFFRAINASIAKAYKNIVSESGYKLQTVKS